MQQLQGVYNLQEPHFWTLCTDVYIGTLKLLVAPDADTRWILSQTHHIFTQVPERTTTHHISHWHLKAPCHDTSPLTQVPERTTWRHILIWMPEGVGSCMSAVSVVVMVTFCLSAGWSSTVVHSDRSGHHVEAPPPLNTWDQSPAGDPPHVIEGQTDSGAVRT